MGVYLIFGVALLLLLVVSLYAARMVWRVIWKTSQAVPPLEAEIAECRRTVQHDLTPSVDAARRELGQLRESAVRMNAQLEADLKAHWDTQLKAELDAHKSALSHQLADIRASLPPAKPAYEDPIPFLDGMSEQDVLRIAKELAFVRPLAPYPNWYFDADWQNPDLAFRMRRSILTYFRSRKTTAALEIPWHCGLQLQIYFGNDLSGQLYVGGCIDPNEFALLDKLLTPGMVFLDIGANEGIYSVFASHRVGNAGSVWAFEPSGREMDRLNANVRAK